MAKKVTKKTVTETIEDDGSKKTRAGHATPKTSNSTKKKSKSKKKRKSHSKSSNSKSDNEKRREELLIENFVGLQHAMTNMSIKFGTLSDNISKLLSIFEEAAKGFVIGDKVDDEQMLNKIDALLDQNKTIAKGLVLMEEKVRTRIGHSQEAQQISEEANKFSSQEVKAPLKPHQMETPRFGNMRPSGVSTMGPPKSTPSHAPNQSPRTMSPSASQQSSPDSASPPRFNESSSEGPGIKPKPLPQI